MLYDKKGTNRLSFGRAPAGNPGMSFNDDAFNKLILIRHITVQESLFGIHKRIFYGNHRIINYLTNGSTISPTNPAPGEP
jgi:hypothetical protein